VVVRKREKIQNELKNTTKEGEHGAQKKDLEADFS